MTLSDFRKRLKANPQLAEQVIEGWRKKKGTTVCSSPGATGMPVFRQPGHHEAITLDEAYKGCGAVDWP